jgi:hypothetical protein
LLLWFQLLRLLGVAWRREGAQSRSCGHGPAIGLPVNVWECDFTITGPTGTYEARAQWTDTGTATVNAGPRAQVIRWLDGSVTAVDPGGSITVTEEPVLVESSPWTSH